jgi:Transmembrane amino acid transporter protein.
VVWVGAVSLVEIFSKQNFWHNEPAFVDAWLYRFQSTNVNILLVFTVVLAVAVPTISPFISLIGALCFSILGLIVPAFIEVITFWDHGLGPYNWRVWKNIVVSIFGVMALVFGSYTSIREIVNLYTDESTK